MGSDETGLSQDQLTAIATAISGAASAGTILAAEAIDNELAKRFHALSTEALVERDLDGAYETVGRALILALQACGHTLSAAFDAASGAMLEAKKPLSVFAPPFTVTLAVADNGATTHLSAHAEHVGMDWGQNTKVLNQLLDKTNEYLTLFKR
jgi:hypothetical protein